MWLIILGLNSLVGIWFVTKILRLIPEITKKDLSKIIKLYLLVGLTGIIGLILTVGFNIKRGI